MGKTTDQIDTILNMLHNQPSPTQMKAERQISVNIIANRKLQKKPKFKKKKQLQEDFEDVQLLAKLDDREKTAADTRLIFASMRNHFILKNLDEVDTQFLVDAMRLFKFEEKEKIVLQDSQGQYFFIVAEGQCEVRVNKQRVAILRAGYSFGELALLHNAKRTSTVRSMDQAELWALDKQTFLQSIEKLNQKGYNEKLGFINGCELFTSLNHEQKDALAWLWTIFSFKNGQRIVHEGDSGDLFYIIKSGSVKCTKKGIELRQMGAGEFFGEQAIIYERTRTVSVQAIEDSEVLGIGSELLQKILCDQYNQVVYRNSIVFALENDENLQKLSPEQIKTLAKNVYIASFTEKDTVIPAGTEFGEQIWIVLKGTVTMYGQVFADRWFCLGSQQMNAEKQEAFEYDLVAENEVDVAEISKEDIERVVGGQLTSITDNNEIIQVLKTIKLFNTLGNAKLNELATSLQVVNFETGQDIVKQGEIGDWMYIVRTGQVDIYKDGTKVRSLQLDSFFGEASILKNQPRNATVTAATPVIAYLLTQNSFQRIVDAVMIQTLFARMERHSESITLNDLSIVKILDQTVNANVYLASHNTKKTLYALKVVHRQKIEMTNTYDSLVQERDVNLQIDHSMITKLVQTFRDENRIYFLLEFVQGTKMYEVIRQIGLLNDDQAVFYASCLLLILEHLHDRDIVHRDLKPENLLLDDEGYPVLLGFGAAKFVNGRTYTVVGTPHYMAPEVIQGKGHGLFADFWSLGIMIYEFICGGVPFGEDEDDPVYIYEKVLERKLVFPSFLTDTFKAKKIIEQLLSKDQTKRNGGSWEKLKGHFWFVNIDWEKLLMRELTPPMRPKLQKIDLSRSERLQEVIRAEDAELTTIKYTVSAPDDWDIEF